MSEVKYWLFLFVYIIFIFFLTLIWIQVDGVPIILLLLTWSPCPLFPPLPVVPVPLFYLLLPLSLHIFLSFLYLTTFLMNSLSFPHFLYFLLLLSNSYSPHLHSFTINSLSLLSPSLSRFPLLPSLFSWSSFFRPSWQQFPQFKARHPLHAVHTPSLRVPQCCTI